MSDGLLALTSVGEDCHLEAVLRVSSDMPCDRPLVLSEITPYKSYILPLTGFIEKLFSQVVHGLFRLSHYQ